MFRSAVLGLVNRNRHRCGDQYGEQFMSFAGNGFWSRPRTSIAGVFLSSMLSEMTWNSWISYSGRQPASSWTHEMVWYLAVWVGIPIAATLLAIFDDKYRQWSHG